LPETVHRKVKSSTMPRSSLEAFSTLWRAYGEGRLERSLDLIDPECEFTLPDGTPAFRGHDGVREWLAASRRNWKTLTITYDDVHEERPGCVVGVGHVSASAAAGGAQIEGSVAFVAEFRGGRLVRGRLFHDGADALRYARDLRPDHP
jgi:ketosteroid isomerase-like protein